MHIIFKKINLCAFSVQTAYRSIVKLVWLAANIAIFAHAFWVYAATDEYLYLRQVTKLGLAFSRASAAVIMFNSVLLVLLVCRNLVSAVKGIPFMPKPIVQTLDGAVTYHRALAITICVNTVIHVIGHISNCTNIIMSCVSHDPTTQYLTTLMFRDVGLPMNRNGTREGAMENLRMVAQTRSIVTGIVLCVILVCIMFTARQAFRRVRYNVFWYLHKVFFLSFFVLLCIHAMGLLKYQSNIEDHNPATCIKTLVPGVNQTYNATSAACSVAPKFKSIPPGAWKWVVAPLVIYIVEKLVRLSRHFQRCTVTNIVKHSKDVLELQMKKKGFKYGLGEYVFLFCPRISPLEWHPFSLTSHPREDTFSVHIRLLGDWTKKLDKICQEGNYDPETCQLKIVCDGPYRSPASSLTRYKTIICIGSNIGITPFVSVLKSFLEIPNTEEVGAQPSQHHKKVYFYWMCRSEENFEWLKGLLQKLEQDLAERGDGNTIEYNLHLTRGMKLMSIKSVANRYDSVRDHITGLQNKTHFGRPRWGHVFEEVINTHKGSNVGVFVCGAKQLSDDLNACCQKYSDGETNFFFHPESFG